MTIRFAAAHSAGSYALARSLTAKGPCDAANDNRGGHTGETDPLLKAALRHFAKHGLSAAEQARRNAEDAFFAGKSEEYRWWLAICSALDRRMAAAVEFRRGASTDANRSPGGLADELLDAPDSAAKTG